jgi:peptide/nickel transport system substrate-binding protein
LSVRWRSRLATLGAAVVLVLAACEGGGPEDSGVDSGGDQDVDRRADVRDARDHERRGPVEIDGAREGGTVHVWDRSLLLTSLDPTEAYFRDSTSLLSGLVVRSLTQYA